jgi:tetratricopeptide (TPR) repeat protein
VSARARDAWLAAALFAGTASLYLGLARAGFVTFDDPEYVSANPVVQQGLALAGLRWALVTDHAGNWFPLTWASHMLDVTLFGLDPRGHHASSVLLHAASAVVLFAWLRGATGEPWRAAFAAALFAWHPLRVESVAWVAERKDVLCALFGLLSLAAWSSYLRSGGAGRYAASLGCFALGLLAKPMLVTLPLLLVVAEIWPLRRVPCTTLDAMLRALARSLAAKTPFLVLSAASCAVTLVVQRAATTSLDVLPLAVRLASALAAIATYLHELVWPADLAVLHPYGEISLAATAVGAALILGGSGFALAGASRRPWLAAGWLWFLGALVPVLGVVQVGEQTHADRYTYLPSIGLCWIAAWAWPARASLLAAGVCLALAVATVRQVRVWRDGVTLFAHAAAVVPDSASVRVHLGNAYAAEGRFDEAAAAYQEALRLDPSSADATHHLGLALAQQGRAGEATRHFEDAIRLAPEWADPHHDLGVLAARQGDFARARDHLARARELRPESASIRLHYALALQALGEIEAAREELRAAAEIDPHAADVQRALAALGRAGRP